MLDSKRCPKCGQNKPSGQFFKKQPQEDELEELCKVCYMVRCLEISNDKSKKDEK